MTEFKVCGKPEKDYAGGATDPYWFDLTKALLGLQGDKCIEIILSEVPKGTAVVGDSPGAFWNGIKRRVDRQLQLLDDCKDGTRPFLSHSWGPARRSVFLWVNRKPVNS